MKDDILIIVAILAVAAGAVIWLWRAEAEADARQGAVRDQLEELRANELKKK